MTEFLASRTWKQWLAFAAWAWLIAVIVYMDVKTGKPVEAAADAVIFSFLFVAAAYVGHKQLFG